jgi:hypothetical protein
MAEDGKLGASVSSACREWIFVTIDIDVLSAVAVHSSISTNCHTAFISSF